MPSPSISNLAFVAWLATASPLGADAGTEGAAVEHGWREAAKLAEGEVLVLAPPRPRRETEAAARAEGLLVVDLSDAWAPFLFSESDGPGLPRKPNAYRETFVALANDRVSPDELFFDSPEGRAAVLSAVAAELRSTEPGRLSPAEERALDRARRDLRRRRPNFLEVYGIPPTLSVLVRRVEEDSRKDCFSGLDREGLSEFRGEIAFHGREAARRELEEALARKDETRLRAVRAVQERLVCEGLLEPGRFLEGAFDLPTHLALAEFERKHDLIGWGSVAARTREALLRALGVSTGDDLAGFLREAGSSGFERLRVSLPPPALPPDYAPRMDLSVEIDRGDVRYDFPFDESGRPVGQPRERFPSLTVRVTWRGQAIPLVRWRTTIGSWRSELRDDGRVYLLEERPGGSVHDDRTRTHGSVDYTSIARRDSHGCHRLANHRAVRLFDFLLRRREHRRLGEQSLGRFRRRFVYRGRTFEYELRSRGDFYELVPPVPVNVLEGRIRGRVASPLPSYFPKPGIDYRELPADSPIEPVPVAGP